MDLRNLLRHSRLRRILLRFGGEESGNYAIMAALTMPVVVGLGGLGTEAGLWVYSQQTAQGAADLAAYGAALTEINGGSGTTEAKAAAASYGFVDGVNGVTVTVNTPPQSGTHRTTAGAVEVIVRKPQSRMISSLFGSGSVNVSGRAVAVANGSGPCLVALAPSGSGTVSIGGNSQVTLSGCTLYDDSNHSSAVNIGGSAKLSAFAVDVVGGVSGTSSITATAGIVTGASVYADPYAAASFGSYSSLPCLTQSSTATTLSAGRYCSGITLNAGQTLTLNSGIYYIDGSVNGSGLSIAGNATLTGDGVTLVFTGSGSKWADAKISSNATVDLSSPTTGTAGIVLFGDPNMPQNTNFKLEGGGTQIFGGAIYLPKGALTFNGGSSTGTKCTQLVAYTASFSGNSNLAMNCSSFGVTSTSALATLVE